MALIKKRIVKFWLDIFDLIVFLVLIFWIILFIRFFVGTPYTVVGASMMPTFEEKDRIIVEKITQRFGTLKRGDILVFVPPYKKIPYIKRIIGLPWEVVKIADNKTYICNKDNPESEIIAENGYFCTHLQEDYLSPDAQTQAKCGKTEFELNNGYFVMGDNRGFTTDSLCCFWQTCYEGANYIVPYNYMIGKVVVRLWPSIDKF